MEGPQALVARVGSGPEDCMSEPMTKIAQMSSPGAQHDKLPFRIELCIEDANAPERVLTMALNGNLARAIFKTAQKEYPGRRIVLREDKSYCRKVDPFQQAHRTSMGKFLAHEATIPRTVVRT
jgi:hypothetical protein